MIFVKLYGGISSEAKRDRAAFLIDQEKNKNKTLTPQDQILVINIESKLKDSNKEEAALIEIILGRNDEEKKATKILDTLLKAKDGLQIKRGMTVNIIILRALN